MTPYVAITGKLVLAFLVGLLACLVLLTLAVRTLGEAAPTVPTRQHMPDMMPGMQMKSP